MTVTRENRSRYYDSGEQPMSDAPFLAMLKSKGYTEWDPDLLAMVQLWSPSAKPTFRDIAPSHRAAFLRLLPDKGTPPPAGQHALAVDTAAMAPPVRTEYYGWMTEQPAPVTHSLRGIEDLIGDGPADSPVQPSPRVNGAAPMPEPHRPPPAPPAVSTGKVAPPMTSQEKRAKWQELMEWQGKHPLWHEAHAVMVRSSSGSGNPELVEDDTWQGMMALCERLLTGAKVN